MAGGSDEKLEYENDSGGESQKRSGRNGRFRFVSATRKGQFWVKKVLLPDWGVRQLREVVLLGC